MAEEGITFGRITRIYREETGRNTLTKLEPDFYEKLNEYIAVLRSRAGSEIANNPHSSKALLLQDELRKIVKKRDQIYRVRERKIVLMASAYVGGTEIDTRILTRSEKDLFERLVRDLKVSREKMLSTEKKEPGKGEPVEQRSEELESQKELSGNEGQADLAVVQVLEDIPPFAGIDVTYELRKEEVVTLPKKVAKILAESGKARVLEIGDR